MSRFSRPIILAIAVFYGYGGLVHLANMAGFSGYSWADAPTKWQVLDLLYLSMDFIVCVGLFRGWRMAVPTFFAANLSQIVLYTLGASWIMDVPAEFLPSGHEMSLGSLVGFHLITLVLMCAALLSRPSDEEP
jgi:hypothetical protein